MKLVDVTPDLIGRIVTLAAADTKASIRVLGPLTGLVLRFEDDELVQAVVGIGPVTERLSATKNGDLSGYDLELA